MIYRAVVEATRMADRHLTILKQVAEKKMHTKANPKPGNCYDRADPDEPIFSLLGRDRHAPTLIWLWAAMRAAEGDAEAASRARADAVEMMAYLRSLGRSPIGVGAAVEAGVIELRAALARVGEALGESAKLSDLDVLRAFL